MRANRRVEHAPLGNYIQTTVSIRKRGRPEKTWLKKIKSDLVLCNIMEDIALKWTIGDVGFIWSILTSWDIIVSSFSPFSSELHVVLPADASFPLVDVLPVYEL